MLIAALILNLLNIINIIKNIIEKEKKLFNILDSVATYTPNNWKKKKVYKKKLKYF